MSVTLYDISEKAGVSTATVSRVINNSPLVTEKTRRKVMRIIEDLHYHPNPAARSLAGQTTQTLGVLFPDFDSGFYTEVLMGIDDEAAAKGYHLMVGFSHGVEDEERMARHYLFSRRIDALVMMNLTFSTNFLDELAGASTIPAILLDRPCAGGGLCSISLNNEQGAELAIQHLAGVHGYRDIGVIRGPLGNYDADGRMRGVARALARLNLEIPGERVFEGDYTEGAGYAAMDRMIQSGKPLPQAVFAMNDAMALGALSALSAAGMRVPQDVAVMGFDDIISARHMRLSTIQIPMREMGRLAARAALQSVLEKTTPESKVLDLSLAVRSTCGCTQG